jgi:hypothetical protein
MSGPPAGVQVALRGTVTAINARTATVTVKLSTSGTILKVPISDLDGPNGFPPKVNDEVSIFGLVI